MKQNLLSILKKELENTFGRKIVSSGDCNQMVEDIYNNTGQTVNANTLRRFFGLVKADYPPSSSTLNILAKYCGFNSIDEIESISSFKSPGDDINKEEVLRYLVALYRNTKVPSHQHEMIFYPLVEQTILFLERNQSLIDKFQREVARTPAGRYYYYEKMVNMDRLEGYYGNGLRHYLRATETAEGKVFAHAMQVFRYWLTNNHAQLNSNMTELLPLSITSDFPHHIIGRYLAARLYYANMKNDRIDTILAEIKKHHGSIKAIREGSHFYFPDFELIISEALILTGNYDEGAEYIWQGKTYLRESGQDQKNLFNLWEGFSHNEKNHRKKTRAVKGSPSFYYSFSKKYSQIVELLAAVIGGTINTSAQQQLAELIQETGFKRLQSFLS